MLRTVLVISLVSFSLAALADTEPKLDPAAVEYFDYMNKLASQGDAAAEDCLGDLYGNGFGVPMDPSKRFYWHSAAAEKDSEAGKLDMAEDYAWGIGVAEDPAKATAMVQDMAAKGSAAAMDVMGLLYLSGTSESQKDSAKAAQWLTKAAEAGDQNAQVQLGLMYRLGTDVKADPARSKMWLERATRQKYYCALSYLQATSFMVYGYVDQRSLKADDEYGPLAIRYKYKDGRAEDIRLVKSSGNKRVDHAWLDAVREVRLPPWPDNYETSDKSVGIWSRGNFKSLSPDFIAAVKAAINDAKQFPKDVLLRGSKGTGLVTVSFDYLNAAVSNEKIVQSSDEPSEDAAALAAVADAKYPPTPEKYMGVKMPLSITVNFGKVEPASPATAAAPAAATH